MNRLAATLVTLASLAAIADPPSTLSMQGRLLRSDGSPEVGTVGATFRIYAAASGGSPLWEEVQSLPLTNGFYAAALGATTAFPATLFDSPDRYLEVVVGGLALGPRQKLHAAPYATRAQTATNVNGGTANVTTLAASGQVSVSGAINNPTPGVSVVVNDALDVSDRVYARNGLENPVQGASLYVNDALDVQSDLYARGPLSNPVGNLTITDTTDINGDVGMHGVLNFNGGWAQSYVPSPLASLNFVQNGVNVLRLTGNKDVIVDRDLYIQGVVRSNINAGTLVLGSNTQIVGNFSVTGTKSFVQPHPTDPTKEIFYNALEGGEAGTYARGKVKLDHGKAKVALPAHFALVTTAASLTVQVTPSADCQGWVAVEQLDVKTLSLVEKGGASGCEVHWLVQGVRAGYEDFQVVRNRPTAAR